MSKTKTPENKQIVQELNSQIVFIKLDTISCGEDEVNFEICFNGDVYSFENAKIRNLR